MADTKSYILLALAALLAISAAAPSPKKEILETQEDLKTDSTFGLGYSLPFLGYGGYYPYYGYSLGLGYGYGFPRYYGGYPYYY